ncbi:phosphate ABC transporter substrate-binding protein [Marinibactrum halimedae]|uniref:ABC transporter substrate-binding protein n=1 Tax=Marinibactrum halimedae TaxID=1444977 RepID=A0AA37WMC5_9GAMM|nr:phosphate ABC transporter substrate-binding protein [Marinibactrum halimedae]MCD9457866.1 phosphate ABC transporter substrate-binding protein [Marinibactrum halimedae]GLS26313.1 ABC transporter substrate-binding protein [Marinibactrum halimedae]
MNSKLFKKVSLALSFSIAMLCVTTSTAGVAVVVHPSNANTIAPNEISKIFLGKKKTFPDGSDAIPLDQQEGSATRSSFVSTILNKNDQQIKAYWAQLLFTGKGTPPREVGGDADVKGLIAQNPSLIGYIDSNQVDSSVKVVHQF